MKNVKKKSSKKAKKISSSLTLSHGPSNGKRVSMLLDKDTYINVKKLAVDKGLVLRDILMAGYNQLRTAQQKKD